MKRTWQICIVVVAAIILATTLLGFLIRSMEVASVFVLFALSDQVVKKQLDNPYINADFAGWKDVEIVEVGSLMIPSDWDWAYDSDTKSLILTNSDAQQLAFGFVCKSEDGLESVYTSMEAHIGFTPQGADYYGISGFVSLEGCYFDKIRLYNDTDSCDILSLSLVNRSQHYALLILFPSVDGDEFVALLSIAQAIVYSYVF